MYIYQVNIGWRLAKGLKVTPGPDRHVYVQASSMNCALYAAKDEVFAHPGGWCIVLDRDATESEGIATAKHVDGSEVRMEIRKIN